MRLECDKSDERASPTPFQKIRDGFIQNREALVRLSGIKARFMRQREKRFAQYHKTSLFIKQGGVVFSLT